MKKTMMTLVLCATLGTVTAQKSTTQEQASTVSSVEVTKEMEISKDLGLNDEQRAKMALVNKEFAKAVGDLQHSGLDEAGRAPRLEVLRNSREQKIGTILTEVQLRRLITLRKEMNDQDLVPEPVPAK